MKQSFTLKIVTLPMTSLMLLVGLSACSATPEPPPPEVTATEIASPQPVPEKTDIPRPTQPVPIKVAPSDLMYNASGQCIGEGVDMADQPKIEIGLDEYQFIISAIYESQPELAGTPVNGLCIPFEKLDQHPDIRAGLVEDEVLYQLVVRE